MRSDRSWSETTRLTESTPQGTSKYTSAVFLDESLADVRRAIAQLARRSSPAD